MLRDRELPQPPDVENADQAIEMLCGWIVDGQAQYELFPTAWKDDLSGRVALAMSRFRGATGYTSALFQPGTNKASGTRELVA